MMDKNDADFYSLVKKMRDAQREYFACKCPSNLSRAKKLEGYVDKILLEREKENEPRQNTLL